MAYLGDKPVYFASNVIIKPRIEEGELIEKDITENGSYDASAEGENVKGYRKVNVLVPGEGVVDGIISREVEEIELPWTISIGECAFAYCTNLQTVNAPEALTLIRNAFLHCDKLHNVNFPKVTTLMGTGSASNGIFAECYSLQKISLPAIILIGNYALANAYHLYKIFIGTKNGIPQLESINAFENTHFLHNAGYIFTDNPKALKSATNWSYFANLIYSSTEPSIITDLPEKASIPVAGLTLSVRAITYDDELSYQWYKDGEAIEGATRFSYHIQDATITNEGKYKVVVTNTVNGTTTTSTECVVTIENIIAGEKYTSNVTQDNWYLNMHGTNVFDTNGEYLTDGRIPKTIYNTGFFGANNIAPEITFNFDAKKSFKELQFFFIEDPGANVHLPTNLCVEYKSADDAEWVKIYDGAVTNKEFVLTADTTFKVKSLRFSMPEVMFTFISEIKAFAEPTGKLPHGSLV